MLPQVSYGTGQQLKESALKIRLCTWQRNGVHEKDGVWKYYPQMTKVDTYCLQDGDFETIHLTSH